MPLHYQLLKQFYDEFPNAVGLVTFYHEHHQYPTVKDSSFIKAEEKLAKHGNCVTQDFNTSIPTECPEPCVVMLNGQPVFLPQKNDWLHELISGLCPEMEQEFIFYHESYHAIQRMKYKYPDNFNLVFFEECAADAYASLRLAATHDDASVPLLKYIANMRILSTDDADHLTTFTMDTAIALATSSKGKAYLQTSTPQDFIDISAQIALQDPLYNLIDNKSFHRIADVSAYIKTIPNARIMDTNHKHWLVARYGSALDELSSYLLTNNPKNMGEHTPTHEQKPFFRR